MLMRGNMDKRLLELRAELVARDMKYRELAARLRERGFDVGEYDIAALIAGRINASSELRKAISEILQRQTFELFVQGARSKDFRRVAGCRR